jgi:hypothetical protein
VKISFCVFLFLRRIQRTRGKYLSVYEEYGKFIGVVISTQNRLRIHGKNLCVHGEDAKTHKTDDILVNNGPT